MGRVRSSTVQDSTVENAGPISDTVRACWSYDPIVRECWSNDPITVRACFIDRSRTQPWIRSPHLESEVTLRLSCPG
jgi:hypothetical protein